MKHNYEIIVGNIGQVHDCTNAKEALAVYTEYVNQSSASYGRAAGEDVTIMRDGEPWREYVANLNSEI